MPRQIKLSPDSAAMAPPSPEIAESSIDSYKDRLVKLIPSEIVTAYVTIQGLLSGVADDKGGDKHTVLWIVFVILFILTPVYLYVVSGVRRWPQIIYSTIAFFIWVLVIGGPISTILEFPAQFIGSIILVIYTLLIPFIYKG